MKKFRLYKGKYYTVDLDIPFLESLPIKAEGSPDDKHIHLTEDVEVTVKILKG